MNKETYGALKRIIEEVKEYRKLPTNNIGGNDIQLIESWIKETAKEEEIIKINYYSTKDFPALDKIIEKNGKKYKVIDNAIYNTTTAKLVK